MNTDGLRTSSSPSGETLTSVSGSGLPIEPGFTPPIGLDVAMPPHSVWPHTSTISSPSAMYQQIDQARSARPR